MKKTLWTAISLIILWENYCIAAQVPVSTDQSQSTASSFFSGGRIGFGIAGEYIHTEANFKMTADPTLDNIGSNQSQIAKNFQLAPSFEIGNKITNNYYVGLVLSWRYSGAEHKSRLPIKAANYFLHEFKLNHYTDIMIKPGYKFTPRTMFYGLIGPSIVNWTHTSNQFDGNQILVNSFKTSKISLGLGIGVGFEFLSEKKYAFSVDYTHHFHKSASKAQPMSYLDPMPRPPLPPLPFVATGDTTRRIQPSYGVLAARFTLFFNL